MIIVLASSSPRRQELLRNAAIAFTVQPADIDETPLPKESPRDCAERLAREKARTVHRLRPHEFILAADTIVVVNGIMLGKPRDAEDAARMLRMLSGGQHQVITGVCLIAPPGAAASKSSSPSSSAKEDIRSETTVVTMSAVPEEEIAAYAASREPLDKAGGYAIQGIASRWVSRIEGDYCNVMGLPVALVYSMLRKHGGM